MFSIMVGIPNHRLLLVTQIGAVLYTNELNDEVDMVHQAFRFNQSAPTATELRFQTPTRTSEVIAEKGKGEGNI